MKVMCDRVSVPTEIAFETHMPRICAPLIVKLLDNLPEDLAAEVCLLAMTRIRLERFMRLNYVCRMRNLREVSVHKLKMNPALLSTLASFEHLTHLNMHRTNLCDEGLRSVLSGGMSNLRVLDVSFTEVTDLAPLARLANLEHLNAFRTRVSDLAPLSGLTKLRRLNLGKTEVLNLAPIRGLVGLEVLTMSGSHIADISPLAGLTRMRTLTLWADCHSRELSALSGLTAMRRLQLWGTSFRDISALSTMTQMMRLDLYNAPNVKDVAPVALMPNLWFLRVGSTDVGSSVLIPRLHKIKIEMHEPLVDDLDD